MLSAENILRPSKGLAWVSPALDRPEDQRSVEPLGINAGIAKPALTMPLPAGRQTTPQLQAGLPVTETDPLAQQQPGHHPAQEHQMTLALNRAVLTEEGDQFSMKLGTGCHGIWIGFAAPRSHGYRPTQSGEILSFATGFAVV